MTEQPERQQRLPGGTIALLALATVIYLFMLWNAAATPDLESIDKGVAAIYALISIVLLWITLGVLLVTAGLAGSIPGWTAIAALVLQPISGVAAGAAVFMLAAHSNPPHWPIGILIVLPPLVALYAIWARLPQWHAMLPPTATGIAVWGTIFVISIGLLGTLAIRDVQASRQAAIDRRDAEAQKVAQETAKQQQNVARFQALAADAPLSSWQEFIGKGNVLQRQAIERVRALPGRQTDAEAMLRDGNSFPLFHIRQLDLHATPEFCASTSGFLIRNAADHRPAAPDRPYSWVADQFDVYLPAIRFLVDRQCDLAAAITATEDAVRAYSPAPEREQFLAALVHLQPYWRGCNGANDATRAQRIAGCTALIDAGATAPEDLAVARFNRGGAYLQQAQTDQAIADYTAAVELNPAFAQAFNNRGNAYDDAGELDRALHDYDAALRIDPGFALALSNRGLVYDERGEHDRAVQDYDEALRIDPTYRNALRNRGRARFYQGNFSAAAQDFSQALSLDPTDAYTALWLAVARGRAGQSSQAASTAAVGPIDHKAWPWSVIGAFVGEQSAEAVLAAARGSPEQNCDASFYLGEKALIDNQISTARDLLRQAQTVCAPNSVEYTAARSELGRTPP